MKWFRFYSEVLDDPKVQRLNPVLFRHWVNILCLANTGSPRGALPDEVSIAYRLRLSPKKAGQVVAALEEKGLLEKNGAGQLTPHSWGGRQPQSDNAPERMRNKNRRSSEQIPNGD